MIEALEWAADYAERNKIFEPVTNARGYADGWKPPTPEEKRRIITDIAREVCTEGSPVAAQVSLDPEKFATLCGHGAIICARCDFIPDSWKELFSGR